MKPPAFSTSAPSPDPKGSTVSTASLHASPRTPARPSHRRTFRSRLTDPFKRFGGWVASKLPAVYANEDESGNWSQAGYERPGIPAQRQPKALPPAMDRSAGHDPNHVPNDPNGHGHMQSFGVPPQRPQQPVAPPPLALPPRESAHTLAWMMRRLADLMADPTLTATKALKALQEPNEELSKLYRAEVAAAEQAEAAAERHARRAQQSVSTVAALAQAVESAAGLPGVEIRTKTVTDPVTGEEREVLEGLLGEMTARRDFANDPRPTSQIPLITEDMPDPRTAPVEPGLQQTDANPGDLEAPTSPVHADDTDTHPAVPADAPEPAPLPHRESDPAATQLMSPIDETAVMDVLESTGGAR